MLADVVMLPGESFVRAIVLIWKTNFGTTKICFDVSMAVIAAVLSFVFAGRLDGVREGTVIAALLVGFIARLIGKKLAFLKGKREFCCLNKVLWQKDYFCIFSRTFVGVHPKCSWNIRRNSL